MQAPMAPASDALFNAVIYTNGQLMAEPRSEADWSRLRDQTRALAEAARTLQGLAPPERQQPWLDASRALVSATADAAGAIERRNPDELLTAGGAIYETCTNCHAAYIGRDEP